MARTTLAGKPHRLTTPGQLVEAGLAAPGPARRARFRRRALCDRSDPGARRPYRHERSGRPDRPPVRPRRPRTLRDPSEMDDPIGDDAKSPIKGLVHRYPDRVLIKLVAVCAVYCRFCFRRERIGPGIGFAERSRTRRCARLRPRAAGDLGSHSHGRRSADPVDRAGWPRRQAAIAAIDHVKTLRWHTRVPVAAPRAGHAVAGARDSTGRKDRRCGRARQPPARIDERGARGLSPARRARESCW